MGEHVSSWWRSLRRRILTPDVSETTLDVRGFHVKGEAARELLETVGASFLTGYGHAMQAGTVDEAADRVDDELPVRFRGFAHEGAAMGFAMLDGLPIPGSGNVRRYLDGRGDPHVYMAYVGIGWAMARLPRFRWPAGDGLDPLLCWLALDGYGFHQAFFRTERYVHEQFEEPDFPWPAGDRSGYAARAIDQGIGRAIWFVGGTDVPVVTKLLDSFAPQRRADLYSGAGLAATYAGGVDADELQAFWDHAGEYRPLVAQAGAFAAEARVRAGLVVPHTNVATQVFCGMTPQEAAEVAIRTQPDQPDGGELPAYEVWRQRIANEFVSLGRC